MAGYVACRDALVAVLAAVANVGEVHDYQRFVVTASDATSAFKNTIDDTEMIQFADVHLVSVGYQLSSLSSATTWRYSAATQFRVRVFRSLNDADASERDFTLLLEALLRAGVTAMSGLTPHLERIEGRISENDHRIFKFPGTGDVLCHYGELLFTFPDQVTV